MINPKVPNFDPIRLRIEQERKNFRRTMMEKLVVWAEGEVKDFQAWIVSGGITPPKVFDDGNPTGIRVGAYKDGLTVVSVNDESLVVEVLDLGDKSGGKISPIQAGEMLDKGVPGNNQVPRPHQHLLQKKINDGAPAQIKRLADDVFKRVAGR